MGRASVENWVRHSVAVDALRTVSEVFRAREIPLFPVKGVVLGRWLYDDPSERPLRDLDLLVRRIDRRVLRPEIERQGWTIVRDSEELGELEFVVRGIAVEAHAEVVRRDLTKLTVEDLLARSTIESSTFGFDIHRIDDIDHVLLLLVEVVKDWFVDANVHQPEDLERLLARTSDRKQELITRATEAGFLTGLYNAALWLAEEHNSAGFREIVNQLEPPRRRLQPYLVRRLRMAERPERMMGLALSCWTNDRWRVRTRCLATIVRRGLWRAVGLDPH